MHTLGPSWEASCAPKDGRCVKSDSLGTWRDSEGRSRRGGEMTSNPICARNAVCIHHMYKNKRWEARAYQQSIVIRAILLVNNVLACPQYRAGSKPRGHSSPDNKDGAPTSPLPTPDEVAARICFVCVCVRACVCMRERVCVCVYICLYVCMYVYSLYACMHACMYVYTHAHAHTHYMYTKNKGGGAHPGDPARQRHIAPHAPHSHVPHPAGGGRPAGTYSL